MKTNLLNNSILALMLTLFFVPESYAVHSPGNSDPLNNVTIANLYGIDFNQKIPLTIGDIIYKNRKEIEHKLNKKLSIKQWLVIRFGKNRINILQQKGYDINSAFLADGARFNIIPFAFGLFP